MRQGDSQIQHTLGPWVSSCKSDSTIDPTPLFNSLCYYKFWETYRTLPLPGRCWISIPGNDTTVPWALVSWVSFLSGSRFLEVKTCPSQVQLRSRGAQLVKPRMQFQFRVEFEFKAPGLLSTQIFSLVVWGKTNCQVYKAKYQNSQIHTRSEFLEGKARALPWVRAHQDVSLN